jgi:hypothetical protein
MATKTKTKDVFAAQLKRWRQPGAAGFFAFLDDARPMIPSDKGGFQPYMLPSDLVRDEIARALDGSHSTIVFCWPRRHGKTVVVALIIAWRFLTRQTHDGGIVANSERQTVDTAFRLVRTILQQTPYTKQLIASGAIRVGADMIEYPALGNRLQGFASNASALYGKKLALAQVSELHAAKADGVYQVLASSTIDTEDGVVLVDSTVGPRSSPLYGLYQLAQSGADPTIYFSHIHYRDLEDAIARGPAWIKPDRIRSRAKQMLPAEFAMQHLNQWGSGTNALFPGEVIDRCRDSYALDAKVVADGRAFAVGAGLDRALIVSLHGDKTVLAAVLKTTGTADDEPHFYVLDAHAFALSTEGAIKRKITSFQRDFGMANMCVEQYQSQDLAVWCSHQGIVTDLIHATPKQQVSAFMAMANAANEGRLHIHPKFERVFAEMETFEYELVATGSSEGVIPRFQHAKSAHDDHLYALAWAIYALRDIELNPYEMTGIHCSAPGAIARLCLLNGGDLVPICSEECRSFQTVSKLYEVYRARAGIAPMGIDDFFRSKIVNVGSHSVRR